MHKRIGPLAACMKSRAQLGTVGDLAAQHEMANDCTSSGDYLSGVGGGSRYGHLQVRGRSYGQRAACAYRWKLRNGYNQRVYDS